MAFSVDAWFWTTFEIIFVEILNSSSCIKENKGRNGCACAEILEAVGHVSWRVNV
jgi:hypothetical protein